MFPLCIPNDYRYILLRSLQEKKQKKKTQYTFNCIFTINQGISIYKKMVIYGAGFNHLFSIIHPMYVQYIRLIVYSYVSVWNNKVQNAFKTSHLTVQTAAVQPNVSSKVSQY